MNLELKLALVARGVPAYQTAKEAYIAPNKLSRFVMEIAIPSQNEKARLSEVLDRPADELFPSPTDSVTA